MYIDLEKIKKKAPHAMSMGDYAKSLRKDEPTIILRDYNEPMSPPFKQKDVQVLDLETEKRPKNVRLPYGSRPDVSGYDVWNAIVVALGPGNYCLHMSDSSYTGYDIWELYEYLKNFDSTNMEVWCEETFDCDDFAQAVQGSANRFFKGIPLGTLWYGDKAGTWGHAVNIYYSYTHRKAFLIEPQNDTFYEFNQDEWVPWVVMI